MVDLILSIHNPVQLLWLERYFSGAEFTCRITTERRALLGMLRRRGADAVVLDAAMGEGVKLCRQVRALTDAPLIVLAAEDTLDERVALLRAGADDVVVAGCPFIELLARTQAKLRRWHADPPPVTAA
jgi:DNA-binding response OmpR family regulator